MVARVPVLAVWLMVVALSFARAAADLVITGDGSRPVATLFQPGDEIRKSFFGEAVAKHQDRLIVGAFADSKGGDEAGAAYIYKRSLGGVWELEASLLADDGDELDRFGFSVGIYEHTAVVGA
jgi:hypothetical protein